MTKPFKDDIEIEMTVRCGRICLECNVKIEKGVMDFAVDKGVVRKHLLNEIMAHTEALVDEFEKLRNK